MIDYDHVVVRFGITNKFTHADMDNMVHFLKDVIEKSEFNDIVCGHIEMGYEKKVAGWKQRFLGI